MLKSDVLKRCREIGLIPVLRADSEENGEIFRSLGHLAAYIAAHRTK